MSTSTATMTTMSPLWLNGIISPSNPPVSKSAPPAQQIPLHPPPASASAALPNRSIPPEGSTSRKRKSPDAPSENKAGKRVRPAKPKAQSKKRAERIDPLAEEHVAPPEPVFRSQAISRAASTSSAPPPARRTRKLAVDGDFQQTESHLSSYDAIKSLMRTYKSYFHNPHDPNDWSWKPHPEHPPMGELEYPNSYASEEFLLLEPKDKDHYNPILDLANSIHTIIREYMTPRQQELFGTLPRIDFQFDNDTDDEADVPPRIITPPLRESSRDTSSPSPLHLFRKAITNKDGPMFRTALDEINRRMRILKYPSLSQDIFGPPPINAIKNAISNWDDIPKGVLMQVVEENYQRSVGPHVPLLRQYAAFTSTVYGELMPSFFYDIIASANLDENSLFMDLGSGVGNLVIQASLQTGCRSYGIELLEGPAKVAQDMVPQFTARCHMWGLNVGEVEVEKGDMLASPRVDELLKQADLVLVDNKVFDETLNEALRPKFLDLKEGAIVVSLRPFVSAVNARMTERNMDDMMTAIFTVEEKEYRSGDVSWGNGGGHYYVHRVDREGYRETKSRFEMSRIGAGRRSRTSR